MKMWKKALALVLALTMIIPGVYLGSSDSDKVQAAAEMAEDGSYVTLEYGDVDIPKVPEGEIGKPVPIPKKEYSQYKGWLFAGWFDSRECTKAAAGGTGSYAKFVPADVLSVKAQSTQGIVTGVKEEKDQSLEGKYVLRFVSSVDSLDYKQVGFELDGDGFEKKLYNTSTTVYQKIDSTVQDVNYEYSPKVMDPKSEYFITAKLGVTDTGTNYRVRAFWDTLDGTRVYGTGRMVSVNDALEGAGTINLTFEMEETLTEEELKMSPLPLQIVGYENAGVEFTVVGTTVYAKVPVNKSELKSATYLELKKGNETVASTIYRNLYTKYEELEEGRNTADRSWYDVYKDAGATEFTIATSADLYGLSKSLQSETFSEEKIYVVADIKANEGTEYGWTPICQNDIGFGGIFDGQMHTISGLYVNTGSVGAGLFGQTISGSTIKNLKLTNSVINSTYTAGNSAYVGSIAGLLGGNMETVYSDATVTGLKNEVGGLAGRLTANTTHKVSNCWFDGSVTGGGIDVGGLIGLVYLGKTTMENCLNTGTVTSTVVEDGLSYAGGLIGRIYCDLDATTYVVTLDMQNCLNVGEVTASTGGGVGSVIGRTRKKTTLTGVYTTENVKNINGNVSKEATVDGLGNYSTNGNTVNGKAVIISEEKLTGAQARYNTALDFYTGENDDGVWVAREKMPGLKRFVEEKEWNTGDEKIIPDTSWYDANAAEYTISTAAELYGLYEIFKNTTNFNGKIIKFGADITVNAGDSDTWGDPENKPMNDWIPIGWEADSVRSAKYFMALAVDGQGHTIRGLYTKADTPNIGLFGRTYQGATVDNVIRNLRLENSYFETTYKDGFAAIGSIVGQHTGSILNVYSNATVVSAGNDCGGLIGRLSENKGHQISNCWFDGSVKTSGKYCGGIVGDILFGAEIENCLNTGTIQSTVKEPDDEAIAPTGGLIGFIWNNAGAVTVENCLNVGTVKGANGNSTGSVIGRVRKEITITNTYTTDDVVMAEGETLIVAATGIGRYSDYFIGEPKPVKKSEITGENARNILQGFKFDEEWVIVPNGTPIPKAFAR